MVRSRPSRTTRASPNGTSVLAVRHLAFEPPEVLVLHVDDGIVAADRRLQQALVVGRRRRAGDDEARDVRVPGLERLRMLRGGGAPHADRLAHHQRHARLAAEHVARLGGLVDELVHRAEREIGEAHLDDRPRAHHGGADRGAHDAGLRDRRVGDALRPELLDEALVLAEHAAAAEVLADRPDRRVAPHLLGERQPRRLERRSASPSEGLPARIADILHVRERARDRRAAARLRALA